MNSTELAPAAEKSHSSLTTVRPLFVDLDGTLISTDLLHEGYLRAVRAHPSVVLKTPGWLAQGLAMLKHHVATAAPVDASLLPYRSNLVAHLMAEQARGKPVILATASPEQWARPVAEYLGCFDDVIASNATHNRKSSAKLAAIQAWCSEHGYQEFDYFGDSAADRKIWRASHVAYLVGHGTRFRDELTQQGITCEDIAASTAHGKTYLRALRVTRWPKNILLVLPLLLLLPSATSLEKVIAACLAFVGINCVESAAYLIRDLVQLDADRQHAPQSEGVLAKGLISIPQAGILVTALLGTSVVMTTLLATFFGLVC